jgi:lipoate-protein ligase A
MRAASLSWHVRWQVRIDPPLSGALNMARDHALVLSLPDGCAALRLYRWERPTLSLGRNEPALGRYDPAAAGSRGVDVVRRPTGGRAVLHWRELTYAVAAPARALGGPREAYRLIHGKLAKALASLGIPAEIAPDPPRASPVHAGPCFRDPAGGEIVAGGRKLVGSAQLRVGDALLQHGSILLGDDQGLLAGLSGGRDGGDPRPATVSDLLGREPERGELERAVAAAFGLDGTCAEASGPATSMEAELLERYRSESWTWRR